MIFLYAQRRHTDTIWDEFWCRFRIFQSGNQADKNSTDPYWEATTQFFGQRQTILGKVCLAISWNVSHRVTSMSLGPGLGLDMLIYQCMTDFEFPFPILSVHEIRIMPCMSMEAV